MLRSTAMMKMEMVDVFTHTCNNIAATFAVATGCEAPLMGSARIE